MTAFGTINMPATIQTRKAIYLEETWSVEMSGGVQRGGWGLSVDVKGSDWRKDTLENSITRLQRDDVPWEKAEKMLVLGLNVAGICGEEILQ